MLAEPIMPKCWHRQVVVDAKDVGEHPHAEGVDDGDVDDGDVEVLAKPLLSKCLPGEMLGEHMRYMG
jgi:hypothetical protein